MGTTDVVSSRLSTLIIFMAFFLMTDMFLIVLYSVGMFFFNKVTLNLRFEKLGRAYLPNFLFIEVSYNISWGK